MQNAIDAVVASGGGKHKIEITIDFDTRTVSITDDGIGFPNDPQLLFLGGSAKKSGDRRLFGLVGVGLKVTMFRSDTFVLRSRTGDASLRYEISDAYKFDHDSPPDLKAPDVFAEDPDPLPGNGTAIQYRFPDGAPEDPIRGFLVELEENCLPHGLDKSCGKLLQRAKDNDYFHSRFSGLLTLFFRRFTYAGDVLNRLGSKSELKDTHIKITARCADPAKSLGPLGTLWDGETETHVEMSPTYLLMEDVRDWVPEPRPGFFDLPLGPGGESLPRVAKGVNQLLFVGADDYELLLTNKKGNLPAAIEDYRKWLFPNMNGIILTIGRIGTLNEYLPSGARRVISANGVVTSHHIDLTGQVPSCV